MPTQGREGVSLVIPVRDEAGSLAGVVEQAASALRAARVPYEILVVDDGSSDGGAAAVERRKDVRVVRHPYGLGYGAALKTGIREAAHDRIAIVDGDGTYPVVELPALVDALDEHAMAVGARPGGGGGGMLRRTTRAFLRLLAQYLSGRPIPDLNSGLRAFHRAEVEPLLAILPNGFSFTSTLTLALLTSGRPVAFRPIAYAERASGRSHIRPFHDTLNFVALVVRFVAYFEPLKVFLPLAGTVFVGGLVLGGYYLSKGYVSKSTLLLLLGSLVLFGTGLLADLVVARTRMLGYSLERKDRPIRRHLRR